MINIKAPLLSIIMGTKRKEEIIQHVFHIRGVIIMLRVDTNAISKQSSSKTEARMSSVSST
jgi:hypothetical protein